MPVYFRRNIQQSNGKVALGYQVPTPDEVFAGRMDYLISFAKNVQVQLGRDTIKPDNLVPAGRKRRHNPRGNETRRTCHQNLHLSF